MKSFPLQTCNNNGQQPSGDTFLRNLFSLILLSHPKNEFASMTDKDYTDQFKNGLGASQVNNRKGKRKIIVLLFIRLVDGIPDLRIKIVSLTIIK